MSLRVRIPLKEVTKATEKSNGLTGGQTKLSQELRSSYSFGPCLSFSFKWRQESSRENKANSGQKGGKNNNKGEMEL